MEIFISWHGKRSHAVAVALRKWLPHIVNDFQPWLSSTDIDKGARWSPEIANKLASAKAGIICLTPGNLTAPWILFEAGAISKTPGNTHLCTFLVGLQPGDVTYPLAQFQATRATKEHVLTLVKNLSKVADAPMPDTFLEETFEKWWPDLEKELDNLPPDETPQAPQKTERELLAELLGEVRDLAQGFKSLGADLSQLKSLRENLDTAEELRMWRRLRNESVHQKPNQEAWNSTLDTIYKSSGIANAPEFNRALQDAVNIALRRAVGRKSREEPKPADPAKPADSSHPEKKQP